MRTLSQFADAIRAAADLGDRGMTFMGRFKSSQHAQQFLSAPTKSMYFSVPAATDFQPSHTAMPDRMLLQSGTILHAK